MGSVGGDPAPGVSVGWKARGSGQVLEDIGGRGCERGLGGLAEGVGRLGGE